MANDINLKSFGEFLAKEHATDTLVFAFGRFQPPTIGHERLINVVKEIARERGAFPEIFVSTTQDNAKNPLTFEERLPFLKKMFRGVRLSPVPESRDKKITGIMAILLEKSKSFKHIILVCGDDRLAEFQKKVNAQNGKLFSFASIDFVSSGARTVDGSDNITSISGTRLRAAARNMDFDAFRAGIPRTLSNEDTNELMYAIRRSISVREAFSLDTPTITPTVTKRAVFLIGVPGSGKDFVLDKVLSRHGLTEVSAGKPATSGQLLAGTPLIVNMNADDKYHISAECGLLRGKGYDCKAIFVTVSNNVSKKRNLERLSRGGKITPEKLRESKYKAAIENRDYLESVFGKEHFITFDNSVDLRDAADVTRARKAAELLSIFNEIVVFMGGIVREDINVLFEQALLNNDADTKKPVVVIKKKKINGQQQEQHREKSES